MALLMLHEIISNDRDKDDCLDSKLRMKFNRRKSKVYVCSHSSLPLYILLFHSYLGSYNTARFQPCSHIYRANIR